MPQQTGESNDSQAMLDMQLCVIAWALVAPMASGASAQAGPGQDAESVGLGFALDATEAMSLGRKLVAEDPIHSRNVRLRKAPRQPHGRAAGEFVSLLRAWTGPGHAFYKVLTGAVAPAIFKGSGDVGTIQYRYVLHRAG